ncbi:MAG: enoyl-CoA hydratase-related protein [Bacteroidetes bacterium]|nr:enoyl-CoA hydratase-related protein [Bacteroidota bacterium]
MKNYHTLEIEIKNGACHIWLNRPGVHNAFNDVMIAELSDIFEQLNEANDIVAVVLRGKDRSFCAGVDLNWMRDVSKNSYQENLDESRKLAQCFLNIYNCKKPTIAMVHGVALGGANGLLAACDLAYCDDSATFSLSEVKIGIVPACISPYVIKRIGEYAAKDLMLTGKRIKGQEAEACKLVNKSLANLLEMEEYVQSVVDLLKTSGPNAIKHCKDLIYNITNVLSFNQMHDYTAKMIADIRASEEGQEGMAAFLEKRKPNWI